MQFLRGGKGFTLLGVQNRPRGSQTQERVVDTADPATVNHDFDTSGSCDNDRRLP
jgi:hypothetical protein